MSSVNKAIIVGNLGADPDMRYTQGGQGVCELRVATTETWKGKDGQKNEATTWHRIVVWGKQAESCAQYLKKGRQVYVEGRIQTRDYQDREGQKKYVTEIVASDVKFLGGNGERSSGRSSGGGRSRDAGDDDYGYGQPPDDGDIPL